MSCRFDPFFHSEARRLHLLDGGDRHQLLHLDLREGEPRVTFVSPVQHLCEPSLAFPPLPLLPLQPLPLGPGRRNGSLVSHCTGVAPLVRFTLLSLHT